MMMFINFLVYRTHSIDGTKDSGLATEARLWVKCENELRKQNPLSADNKTSVDQIKKSIKHQMMRKTAFRFKLLRIRQKISYIAYEQRMTIPELILSTILRVYRELPQLGLVYADPTHSYECKAQDTGLLNELLDPWIVNTLSMAV